MKKTFDLFNGDRPPSHDFIEWVPGWWYRVAGLPVQRGTSFNGEEWLLAGFLLSRENIDQIINRAKSDEKCGLSFKSGDANDLMTAILKIYESDVDYGKNGIRAVRTKYNWSIDELNLLKVIDLVCHDQQNYLTTVSMP